MSEAALWIWSFQHGGTPAVIEEQDLAWEFQVELGGLEQRMAWFQRNHRDAIVDVRISRLADGQLKAEGTLTDGEARRELSTMLEAFAGDRGFRLEDRLIVAGSFSAVILEKAGGAEALPPRSEPALRSEPGPVWGAALPVSLSGVAEPADQSGDSAVSSQASGSQSDPLAEAGKAGEAGKPDAEEGDHAADAAPESEVAAGSDARSSESEPVVEGVTDQTAPLPAAEPVHSGDGQIEVSGEPEATGDASREAPQVVAAPPADQSDDGASSLQASGSQSDLSPVGGKPGEASKPGDAEGDHAADAAPESEVAAGSEARSSDIEPGVEGVTDQTAPLPAAEPVDSGDGQIQVSAEAQASCDVPRAAPQVVAAPPADQSDHGAASLQASGWQSDPLPEAGKIDDASKPGDEKGDRAADDAPASAVSAGSGDSASDEEPVLLRVLSEAAARPAAAPGVDGADGQTEVLAEAEVTGDSAAPPIAAEPADQSDDGAASLQASGSQSEPLPAVGKADEEGDIAADAAQGVEVAAGPGDGSSHEEPVVEGAVDSAASASAGESRIGVAEEQGSELPAPKGDSSSQAQPVADGPVSAAPSLSAAEPIADGGDKEAVTASEAEQTTEAPKLAPVWASAEAESSSSGEVPAGEVRESLAEAAETEAPDGRDAEEGQKQPRRSLFSLLRSKPVEQSQDTADPACEEGDVAAGEAPADAVSATQDRGSSGDVSSGDVASPLEFDEGRETATSRVAQERENGDEERLEAGSEEKLTTAAPQLAPLWGAPEGAEQSQDGGRVVHGSDSASDLSPDERTASDEARVTAERADGDSLSQEASAGEAPVVLAASEEKETLNNASEVRDGVETQAAEQEPKKRRRGFFSFLWSSKPEEHSEVTSEGAQSAASDGEQASVVDAARDEGRVTADEPRAGTLSETADDVAAELGRDERSEAATSRAAGAARSETELTTPAAELAPSAEAVEGARHWAEAVHESDTGGDLLPDTATAGDEDSAHSQRGSEVSAMPGEPSAQEAASADDGSVSAASEENETQDDAGEARESLAEQGQAPEERAAEKEPTKRRRGLLSFLWRSESEEQPQLPAEPEQTAAPDGGEEQHAPATVLEVTGDVALAAGSEPADERQDEGTRLQTSEPGDDSSPVADRGEEGSEATAGQGRELSASGDGASLDDEVVRALMESAPWIKDASEDRQAPPTVPELETPARVIADPMGQSQHIPEHLESAHSEDDLSIVVDGAGDGETEMALNQGRGQDLSAMLDVSSLDETRWMDIRSGEEPAKRTGSISAEALFGRNARTVIGRRTDVDEEWHEPATKAEVISDAVISDAVISDEALSDGALTDEAVSDGVISDAVINDVVEAVVMLSAGGKPAAPSQEESIAVTPAVSADEPDMPGQEAGMATPVSPQEASMAATPVSSQQESTAVLPGVSTDGPSSGGAVQPDGEIRRRASFSITREGDGGDERQASAAPAEPAAAAPSQQESMAVRPAVSTDEPSLGGAVQPDGEIRRRASFSITREGDGGDERQASTAAAEPPGAVPPSQGGKPESETVSGAEAAGAGWARWSVSSGPAAAARLRDISERVRFQAATAGAVKRPRSPASYRTWIDIRVDERDVSTTEDDDSSNVAPGVTLQRVAAAEPISRPGAKAKPDLVVNLKPVEDRKPVAETQAEPAAETKPVVEAQAEPAAQAMPAMEAQAEPAAETKPVMEAQAEPAVKAMPAMEAQAEPAAETKPVVDAQAEPAAKAKPVLEAQAEPAADTKPVMEAQAEPAVKAEPVLEAQAEPAVKAKPVLEARAEPAVKAEPVLEVQAEPAAKAKPVLQARPGRTPELSMERLGTPLVTVRCVPTIRSQDVAERMQYFCFEIALAMQGDAGSQGQVTLSDVPADWSSLIVDVEVLSFSLHLGIGGERKQVQIMRDGTCIPAQFESVVMIDGRRDATTIEIAAMFSLGGRFSGHTRRTFDLVPSA